MSLLLLIPGFISLFLVLRGRAETAFLSVFLPCLLLLPEEYVLRVPHLPPFSPVDLTVVPLGVLGFYRLIGKGSVALMDILVVFFALSVGLSEILHEQVTNDGIFSAINAFLTMVLPYMVGRQLIEPDLRIATVRRFVILVLLDVAPGLFEWRMGLSLHGMIGSRVFGLGSIDEHVQMRSGHGRLVAAFSDAEIAGIVFGMTFCLNAWLLYLRRVRATIDLGKRLTTLEKYHVPELLLLLSVWLTQSRGPQMALAAGFLILQIPRFKNTRLMTFVVIALLFAAYMGESAYFKSYTNVDYWNAGSEQQQSAVYRRVMNEIYAPIAEAGGWTGWSTGGTPHIGGQTSIDNQYLLVHLAWGRLAYIFYVLIVWENIRVLLVRSWQFKAMQDRAFAFSMLAAMTILWFTLTTVYLGGQLPHISFLLLGWIQSMVPAKVATSSGVQVAENQVKKFAFRQVFS